MSKGKSKVTVVDAVESKLDAKGHKLAAKSGKVHTVITAEQLASSLGVNGKALRGYLRRADVAGNDGVYTRWAIDLDSEQGQRLVKLASTHFKPPTPKAATSKA